MRLKVRGSSPSRLLCHLSLSVAFVLLLFNWNSFEDWVSTSDVQHPGKVWTELNPYHSIHGLFPVNEIELFRDEKADILPLGGMEGWSVRNQNGSINIKAKIPGEIILRNSS